MARSSGIMRTLLCAAGGIAVHALALAGTLPCPPDSVKVGSVCVDTYEESAWQIDPAKKALVKKVRAGTATVGDLNAAGAKPLGCHPGQTLYPANFPTSGRWTSARGAKPPSPGVYAVSLAGVSPSTCISWFQAGEACKLSGKRLLTNREWEDAKAGTPDPKIAPGPGDCNTNWGGPLKTGSRPKCKSRAGAFDMIGNVAEWLGDWADPSTTTCARSLTAPRQPGKEIPCFGDDGSPTIPGAQFRGGNWVAGTDAGPFAVFAHDVPSYSSDNTGFRCAR